MGRGFGGIAIVLGLMVFSACGARQEIDCGPIDQRGAYMAAMNDSHPVRVLISPEFDASEQLSIVRAAQTWNSLGREVLGHDFFEPRVEGYSDSNRPKPDPFKCNYDGADEVQFHVLRENDENRWLGLGLHSNNTGITIRCGTTTHLDKQVVVINTNPQTTFPVQFMSVALHELGHALGLDHSCDDHGNEDTWIGCDYLRFDHPYRSAVMFPELSVDPRGGRMYETRETLTANDTERAQCRYTNL